ncbi:MAG TPA: extracellular solute-binding protein [Candidatus Binatia bacterium]|jgi:ABC-type Fe3+ transport system substrate-binding protein
MANLKSKLWRNAFLIAAVFAFSLPSSLQADSAAQTQLIEGAKKEGKVVWYTTITVLKSRPILDRFEKKYSFIKGELLRTGGGPLQNRILTEARAGKHLFDAVNGRAEMFLSLKNAGVLTSYKSPETVNVSEDLKDEGGFWSGVYGQALVLGYNTRLVKEGDVPRTYGALLEPKWKGKIINDTENFQWFSGLLRAWGREKALAYMRRLAKQDQTFARGNTSRIQLVAAGEAPLLIGFNHVIEFNKSKGAPIDWVPLEPVIMTPAVVMLANRGPNPNAGKLFIDFLLSREGQEMFRDLDGIPVHKDVEPDPPRLSRGYKRFVLTPEMYDDYAEMVKLYREIFNLK